MSRGTDHIRTSAGASPVVTSVPATQTGQVKCHGCDSLIEPKLILRNVHGWHIVRCRHCSLTFVHPQPDAATIGDYYNGLYADTAEVCDERRVILLRKSIAGYVSVLSKYRDVKPGTTLLDLGAGLGYYSKAFAEAGFDVTPVEQDQVSAEFARTVLGVKDLLVATEAEFFARNQTRYDIVFLRHVIEHATNPTELIRNVEGCLAPGGVLVIETDNNAGIELLFHSGTAKFYLDLYRSSYVPSSFLSLIRRRPFAVDPPRHLFGFRMSNLISLLRRNSLTPLETKCYRLGHPVYWPTVPTPPVEELIGNILHFRLKRLVGNALDLGLWPVRIMLEYAGMGSGICIYAIKKT